MKQLIQIIMVAIAAIGTVALIIVADIQTRATVNVIIGIDIVASTCAGTGIIIIVGHCTRVNIVVIIGVPIYIFTKSIIHSVFRNHYWQTKAEICLFIRNCSIEIVFIM